MRNTVWLSALGLAFVGGETLAQERFPVEPFNDPMLRRRNRISLKATFNFNVKTHFTSTAANGSGSFPRVGPENRSYDDGFVNIDVSGNAGSSTWFWGYNNAGQFSAADGTLAAPNTGAASLAFHSAGSLADGATRGSRDTMIPGIELAYEEVLGRWHISERRRANIGILVTFGWMRLGQNDSAALAGPVNVTTDKYLTGAVLPPLAPYAGSFGAAGPLLPDAPVERTAGVFAGTGTVNNKLEGSLYGFNVGPFIELPLHDRVSLMLGGGLGCVYADTAYTFRETVVVPGVVTASRSGRIRRDEWLFSGIARANLYVALTEAWSWEVGLAYQYAQSYRSTVAGKTANLQLDGIMTVNTGLNYAF